ncbi:Protein SHORT ROOT IN SALT MEDIUM 1, partial [Camellia lanceoleosa]
LMPAYAGSSVGGPDGSSQLSMASRHSSMLGGPQESDITGYRGHPSTGAHYGGQYSSVYGSAALSSGQQVSGMSAKGAGPSALEGRSGYGSAMPDSPKLPSGDFVSSSSHGYGHKSEIIL